MKVPFSYLRKHVDLGDIDVNEVASKLTFAGAEVEGIDYLASGTNLVIGEIKSCVPHPDSDHLHILEVYEGDKYGTHQIVCGAPNARTGLKVIVARVGAKLPQIEIKESTIRGVFSDGMCCSLLELGVDSKYLSEKQTSGIEELPSDALPGNEDVLGYLGLDDAILDISILPNRPDLYSLSNVALEVGCLFEKEVNIDEYPEVKDIDNDFILGSKTPNCSIFYGGIARNVKTKPSPTWLVSLLNGCGIRSINNVVDIGNLVMLITGQPINMYDLDKLHSKSLIVKDDIEGDFVAMDDNTYKLQKGDLCVTNENEVMCLAGIMTSKECMVDESSKNIVIEAAYFKGAPIRHTSSRIGLSSDSSLRFVKGISSSYQKKAIDACLYYLKELGEASSISILNNYGSIKTKQDEISLDANYIDSRLGTSFGKDTIIKTLERDYFKLKEDKDNKLTFLVPLYRLDIDTKADLSEEVIRILGYENVVSTLPTTKLTLTGLTPNQEKKRHIRRYLTSLGLDEVLTYTLISKKNKDRFNFFHNEEAYVLSNPMSEDRSVVRKGLTLSLLETIVYNASRQNKDLGVFEVSDIDTPKYKGTHLGIVLSGNKLNRGLLEAKPYDFYDAKGILEGIVDYLNITPNRINFLRYESALEELHPGKSASIRIDNKLVGVLGELHPNRLKEYGLKNAVVLELDLTALLSVKSSSPKAIIPNKFPFVTRDLAFLCPKETSLAMIKKEVGKSSSLIKNVEAFDIYEGASLLKGQKSMAIRITLLDQNKTLTDEEANLAIAKAIDALAKLHCEIRK